MSLAAPSDKTAEINKRQKALPRGYQRLGTATVVAKEASKVCLEVGSATVEVTALAPDLFRVGFFPDDRPVDYSSVAVVARKWQPGLVTIVEEAGVVTVATAAATAHLSLAQFRIGFTDGAGREFALDDPELGMGWFPGSGDSPVRVYKQHLAGEHYFGCGERTGELDKTGSQQLFWNVDPPRGHTALQNNLYASIPFTLVLSESQAWGVFLDSTTRVEFDLAHDDPQRAWFGAGSGDLVYYVFCGPT
ncbi:MAG TPA: alpha-glucosidase, partial [Candidatus Dormibacteraeota bacterium]|nr:alpha-glucosidase [Candidatus Dormibacteraeota bacterium]